jgi:transposase
VIVRLRESGLSAKEISSRLDRGESTVFRILALHRKTGDIIARNLACGRPRKLDMHSILVRTV